MKFSILVANYNNGHFFDDCYNSIISQTADNWEVIILDDASTDNSVEVIKNKIKGDPRFHFFENEVNRGVGFSKGKLIELANGEICGFLDPDDALLPQAVQASSDIFKNKTDVVLTYSRPMKCDAALNPLHEIRSAMQVLNGDPFFFNCPVQIIHFVGFRKEVYLTCEKMNSTLKIAEDQDLYLKMYEKGNVHFINQTDYLYRAHAGGISQNDNKQKSYEYFAQAIFLAMKRRDLKQINGKNIPDKYTNSKEIFDLLAYQNSIPFRILKKWRLILRKFKARR
ncbi:glycosyltransferase family 2 protein [Kaistella palustris]|uniref:glycosyltransferase family 2 protein n=1 Tax=Kaistella palustris TaxID=493376 RepID=UPI000403764D|nr:glycosyltransferase [Kaistella palustris]